MLQVSHVQRTDSRVPPNSYTMDVKKFGVDIKPGDIVWVYDCPSSGDDDWDKCG